MIAHRSLVSAFLVLSAVACSHAAAQSAGAAPDSSAGAGKTASISGVVVIEGPMKYNDGTDIVGYVVRHVGNMADFQVCKGGIVPVEYAKLSKSPVGCGSEPPPNPITTASIDCQQLSAVAEIAKNEGILKTGMTFALGAGPTLALAESGSVTDNALKQWSQSSLATGGIANPCGGTSAIQIPVGKLESWVGIVKSQTQ